MTRGRCDSSMSSSSGTSHPLLSAGLPAHSGLSFIGEMGDLTPTLRCQCHVCVLQCGEHALSNVVSSDTRTTTAQRPTSTAQVRSQCHLLRQRIADVAAVCASQSLRTAAQQVLHSLLFSTFNPVIGFGVNRLQIVNIQVRGISA